MAFLDGCFEALFCGEFLLFEFLELTVGEDFDVGWELDLGKLGVEECWWVGMGCWFWGVEDVFHEIGTYVVSLM